jgi:hypothetical protein
MQPRCRDSFVKTIIDAKQNKLIDLDKMQEKQFEKIFKTELIY